MSIRRIGTGFLILFFLLVVGVVGYGVYAARAPLPQHSGEIRLTGLNEPVEILRDEWGVPHIYAATPEDLFFAQGYSQAQDRWWQMEFSRQLSQGRLTQLVGNAPAALSQDVQMRALGLRHVAQQELALYDEETLGYLQAFANGVNAYIASRPPRELALEYTALGVAGRELTITPWSPVDTLAYGKFVSIGLSANMGMEPMLAQLYEALPPEMIADFLPDFPYGEKPTIVQREEAPVVMADGTSSGASPRLDLPDYVWQRPSPPGVGSNNWVVDGRYTSSGKPLLANDPHLMIELPSIWYEVGLHCRPLGDACPYDVVGFTFVPFPGVALGHNQAIAWGATVAGPDVQDLYQLRVTEADPFRYQWDGGWREMETREELFTFADGSDPLSLTMRASHHGPIINDYAVDTETGEVGELSGEPMALRWTALEPGVFFKAIFGLNRAADWEEFRQALQNWDFGSMNMVYADVEGNIGFQMPGRVPIRAADHDGQTPAPGWESAYEWQGMIPYEMLPHLYNPERGYIMTANQAVMPPSYWNWLAQALGDGRTYDFHIGHYIYGYRAQRIEELLLANNAHTVQSFVALQSDNKLIAAEEMMPYLSDVKLADPDLTAVQQWLGAWDYQMTADSGQAAFYGLFWRQLLDNLYNDDLFAHGLLPAANVHMWPTTALLADPANVWWDDARTPNRVETRDEILSRTFSETYETAVAEFGLDREKWRWGDLHTATFSSQPLGGLPLLDKLVNRGPLPLDGGANTVNATTWSESPDDYFGVQVLPSMRMVVDLADLGNSVTMNTTGQSGHLASPHYDDQIRPWQTYEFKPMLWARGDVETAVVDTLRLSPVGTP